MLQGEFILRQSDLKFSKGEEGYYKLVHILNICLVHNELKDHGIGEMPITNVIIDSDISDIELVKKIYIRDVNDLNITIKTNSDNILEDLNYDHMTHTALTASTYVKYVYDGDTLTYDFVIDLVDIPANITVFDAKDTESIHASVYSFLNAGIKTFHDLSTWYSVFTGHAPSYTKLIILVNTYYEILVNARNCTTLNKNMLKEIIVKNDRRTAKGKEEYIEKMIEVINNSFDPDTSVIFNGHNEPEVMLLTLVNNKTIVYLLSDLDDELEIKINRETNEKENKMEEQKINSANEDVYGRSTTFQSGAQAIGTPFFNSGCYNPNSPFNTPYGRPMGMNPEFDNNNNKPNTPYGRPMGMNPEFDNNTSIDSGFSIRMVPGITINESKIKDLFDEYKLVTPIELNIKVPGIQFPMVIKFEHINSGDEYILTTSGKLVRVMNTTGISMGAFPYNVPVPEQLIISALDYAEIIDTVLGVYTR